MNAKPFRGLYRTVAWAYVTNGTMSFQVPEAECHGFGYEPDYSELCWKEDYDAAILRQGDYLESFERLRDIRRDPPRLITREHARREMQPFMSRIFLCQFSRNLITQLFGQIDAGYFPAPL